MLLERVLLNLIGNALRYTARGGVLVGTRRRGVQIEIIVADTGIGIAPEQQPLVFQEFYRVPGVSSAASRGWAWAWPSCSGCQPDGSPAAPAVGDRARKLFRLVLELPLTTARPTQAALPQPVPEPLVGRRVLLVDDDEAVLEAMRGQLAQWGCVVTVARSATQALALAHRAAPEVLITDLRLGEAESGLVLARQLIETGPPGLKMAVLTGERDSPLTQAVRDAGLPLLAKPLRPARLRALLESMLDRAGPG